MTFTPIAPTTYVPPTRVAKDTFVIHQVQPALGEPLFVVFQPPARPVPLGDARRVARYRRPNAARAAPAGVRFADHERAVRSEHGRVLGRGHVRDAVPDPKMGIADLDPEFWNFGMTLFALGAVSPWLSMLDPKKYGRHVDTVQNLDITTIAACGN